MPEVKLTAKVDMTEVDEAIKKANRLVELLQEASTIADSLSGKFGLCVELPQTYTNNLVIKTTILPMLNVVPDELLMTTSTNARYPSFPFTGASP